MGLAEHFIGIEVPVLFLIKNFFTPTKLRKLRFTFNNQIVQVIIRNFSSIMIIVNTFFSLILIPKNIISLFKLEIAQWTTWTTWDTCRDDRLSNYGITNTNTKYLTTYQGGNCYNKRTRYCQNQVETGLKYSRFGGYNHCLGNYVSNSNGLDDHETRQCPGLPESPSNVFDILFPTLVYVIFSIVLN